MNAARAAQRRARRGLPAGPFLCAARMVQYNKTTIKQIQEGGLAMLSLEAVLRHPALCGMRCVEMELGEPDASGRRRPVEIPGSEYDMDVDTVIMSLGTSPNPLISSTTKGLEINKRRCIVAEEETGKTSKDGVYAGGDAVTGAATVILAMGAGKAGAKGIDEYLKNK